MPESLSAFPEAQPDVPQPIVLPGALGGIKAQTEDGRINIIQSLDSTTRLAVANELAASEAVVLRDLEVLEAQIRQTYSIPSSMESVFDWVLHPSNRDNPQLVQLRNDPAYAAYNMRVTERRIISTLKYEVTAVMSNKPNIARTNLSNDWLHLAELTQR